MKNNRNKICFTKGNGIKLELINETIRLLQIIGFIFDPYYASVDYNEDLRSSCSLPQKTIQLTMNSGTTL
jgi:hypothetical protein